MNESKIAIDLSNFEYEVFPTITKSEDLFSMLFSEVLYIVKTVTKATFSPEFKLPEAV